MVFAVHDCGYLARCALEVDDGSEARIEKIAKIIGDCRFGLHDISRTEPDLATGLPRFNMPFELGLFLGAKRFGRAQHKQKSCLILDVEPYRFQKFLSDIAGQDIAAHEGNVAAAISRVRDWLSNSIPRSIRIPGGRAMTERYAIFLRELPAMCASINLGVDELTFNDFASQVEAWLKTNPHVAG